MIERVDKGDREEAELVFCCDLYSKNHFMIVLSEVVMKSSNLDFSQSDRSLKFRVSRSIEISLCYRNENLKTNILSTNSSCIDNMIDIC